MADDVKVLIVERNGVELEFQEELDLTATNVPFNNTGTGLIADNTQDAIVESGIASAGFPRSGLPLVQNGTMGNNDLVSYSNLTPNTPISFPVKTQINELTFSNTNNSVECDLQIYVPDINGTLIKTISISTGAGSKTQAVDLNSDNITFNAGDELQIKYKDQGTNASDMVVVLWISRIP